MENMSFEEKLQNIYKYEPKKYLRSVKNALRRSTIYTEDDIRSVDFSNKKNKKLMMRNPEINKFVHWGNPDYGDFLIWKHLSKNGLVDANYPYMKQNTYWKSHSKIGGNWHNNKYSANRLSLYGNW